MAITKLRVCLYNSDAEEYATNLILKFNELEVDDDRTIFDTLMREMNGPAGKIVRKEAREGFVSDFSKAEKEDFSMQTDCFDSVIRLREMCDTIGEGPNLASAINLRLVE